MNLDDTIVAIATPPGRGGIGVVRLAGPDARSISAAMLRLKHGLEPGRAIFGDLIEPHVEVPSPSAAPQTHMATTIHVGTGALTRSPQPARFSPDGVVARPAEHSSAENSTASPPISPLPLTPPAPRIDEVVVTYFAKPHSYTTDDIIEISAHGSPVVLRHIVELAVARGARLAEPGEFTMRAFLNGRLDLTQAEAVRDLIDSQTLFQAQVAAQQLEGSLSRRLKPVKQKLVELIALLEAGIDFAEDDIAILPDATILSYIAEVQAPLHELAASFAYGKIVHEGLTLAIVGRPNVGKSSLFNRLVERERAIVTATPGTTRDLVSETVAIGGIPVKLVDTAGIRRALDEAERIGIQKSMEALADADLVLVVLDASQPITDEDRELLHQATARPAMIVHNKADLRPPTQTSAHDLPDRLIDTSAKTGEGILRLRDEILAHVTGENGARSESGFLTNVRHRGLVADSLTALDAATRAVHNHTPHEMLLMDLYNALRPLDEITGATTNDDILNLIFSTFCIGK